MYLCKQCRLTVHLAPLFGHTLYHLGPYIRIMMISAITTIDFLVLKSANCSVAYILICFGPVWVFRVTLYWSMSKVYSFPPEFYVLMMALICFSWLTEFSWLLSSSKISFARSYSPLCTVTFTGLASVNRWQVKYLNVSETWFLSGWVGRLKLVEGCFSNTSNLPLPLPALSS